MSNVEELQRLAAMLARHLWGNADLWIEWDATGERCTAHVEPWSQPRLHLTATGENEAAALAALARRLRDLQR